MSNAAAIGYLGPSGGTGTANNVYTNRFVLLGVV